MNAYRDYHRVFFSAYDPTTSLFRAASVSVAQVNKLLQLNNVEAPEFGAKGAPTTTEALFQHRRRRGQREQQRGGEAAAGNAARERPLGDGELRAHVYLPEHAAAVELDCGGQALRDLYLKADPLWLHI